MSFTLTKSEAQNILSQLAEPFDTDLLRWRAGATNRDKTSALALVYADPRAYSDRLNDILSPGGWSDVYFVHNTPYTGIKKGWNDKPDVVLSGHKTIVICTVSIVGLGAHSDVGECDSYDENVATVAQAQAFKRACTKFGLGRYFYDFPRNVWAPYDDKTKQISHPPELPDWAVPVKKCGDCRESVTEHTVPSKDGGQPITYSVAAILRNSQKHYKIDLCAKCQKIRSDKAKEPSAGRL